MSETLETVIALLRQREETGIAKYGTTCDRSDLGPMQWAMHAAEESLDRAMYLVAMQRAIPVVLRRAFELGYAASVQGSDHFKANLQAMLTEILGQGHDV
jgi:hypothetical protein